MWLGNFCNKLAAYQATLGLSAEQVAGAIADARWLIYVLGSWLPAARSFAPACTATALAAQLGEEGLPLVLTTFTPPVPPAGVVAVSPGALYRIFALVGVIKLAAGYTAAIGVDLDIVGTKKGAPDFATIQPSLAATVQGDRVTLSWSWHGYGTVLDLLELQVDRGSGWEHLAASTMQEYTDKTPLPATFTRWRYRAIYLVADAQVGVWSAVVAVAVG